MLDRHSTQIDECKIENDCGGCGLSYVLIYKLQNKGKVFVKGMAKICPYCGKNNNIK